MQIFIMHDYHNSLQRVSRWVCAKRAALTAKSTTKWHYEVRRGMKATATSLRCSGRSIGSGFAFHIIAQSFSIQFLDRILNICVLQSRPCRNRQCA